MAKEFVVGGLAAMTGLFSTFCVNLKTNFDRRFARSFSPASCVTHPIDLIKVRMLMYGEGQQKANARLSIVFEVFVRGEENQIATCRTLMLALSFAFAR
jgi:hypothetical protein